MAKQPPTVLRVTYAESVMTVQAGTVGNPGNRKFKNESAFWYALKKTLMESVAVMLGGAWLLQQRKRRKAGKRK